MENLENIIEKMIGQHRSLQDDLGNALLLANNENPNMDSVSMALKQFSIDLADHLHLENDIFYPELLKHMGDSGVDVSKTEDFINQMKDIGVVVETFLQKYKDSPSIEHEFDVFKNELSNIISALNIRIESEEAGVYSYWEMYK